VNVFVESNYFSQFGQHMYSPVRYDSFDVQ
jgi:hypothetical protein